jgi:hypothetical protein
VSWHTQPPQRACKCVVLDTWHNYVIAPYRPDYGWWDGKCWRKDFALCWIDIQDLPAIPANVMRERW